MFSKLLPTHDFLACWAGLWTLSLWAFFALFLIAWGSFHFSFPGFGAIVVGLLIGSALVAYAWTE